MNEFFQSLKQRKLVQWAVAYVAAGFAAIQGIDVVAQQFGWPEGVRRGTTLALVVGFFVTLVLTWYHGERGAQKVTSTELLILALLLSLGGGFLWRYASTTRRSVASDAAAPSPSSAPAMAIPEKSVAVLPFENLSDEKANAYFAEGIQDEILTRLAKIGALKVISRTSTSHLASSPQNLPEIARQLGVANVLEGSVQKAANTVHINVQLIRAMTDDHLWAESYNRTLDNIFGVEGEIAQTVAEALKARLSGAEEKVLAQEPTNNPAVYDAYLRGMAQYRSLNDQTQLAAADSFTEAVRLDPQFAAAWAALSRAQSRNFFGSEMTPARRMSAEKALDEATRLQPDLAETQLARAFFQYWVQRDYKGALEKMRMLRASWPNNADIFQAMAFISARLGNWPEALADAEQSVALNPRDLYTRVSAIPIAMAMRDFDQANSLADSALQIWPNNSQLLGIKALVCQSQGQLDQAQIILNRTTPNAADFDSSGIALFYQAWARRDPTIALNFVDGFGRTAGPSDNSLLIVWGILQDMAGQKDRSRETFVRARDGLVEQIKMQPDNTQLVGPLAFAFACLGQRDEALKAIARYDSLSVGDARSTATGYEVKARIFARFGDKAEVIANLEKVLAVPADSIFGPTATPALLRIDPDFDLLRSDPNFQKLCEERPK